jgi:hypothetical protein
MLLRRLAVVVVAIAALGTATLEPHAAALMDKSVAGPALGAVAPQMPLPTDAGTPLRIDAGTPCPVATGSVIGLCPRPLVSKAPARRGPILVLCARIREIPLMSGRRGQPSVCGVGFHAQDRVDVFVEARYGSTLWRVTADARGSFRSSMPWPLCALTPGFVFAVDAHEARSNPVWMPGAGCP